MPHADPAARRAYYREWKRRNAAKRFYSKCLAAARHANERAAAAGVPGVLSSADVKGVLLIGRCLYCERTTAELESAGTVLGIDHVVSMSDGGPNTLDNIVPCCHSCNRKKHRKTCPAQWSRYGDGCLECGTSDRPHYCAGLCARCFRRKEAAA